MAKKYRYFLVTTCVSVYLFVLIQLQIVKLFKEQKSTEDAKSGFSEERLMIKQLNEELLPKSNQVEKSKTSHLKPTSQPRVNKLAQKPYLVDMEEYIRFFKVDDEA